MYKVCKTKQSAERQRYIVDCLMEMLFSMPFHEITVQALCKKADIPRKTFYRYFEGKEDVFDAMVDQVMLEYERFPGPYRQGEHRTSEKDMEKLLDSVHITCNKNTVPNDPQSPFVTSGLRLGTPAVTSRGLKEDDMVQIAEAIKLTIIDHKLEEAEAIVKSLTEKYPIYQGDKF